MAGSQLIGRALLELSTDNKKLEKGIKKGKKAAKGLDKTFSGVGASIAGVFGGISIALAARELAAYADEWTAVNNQLKIVTNSSAELVKVQTALFNIAQETRTPIGATVKLYARLSLAAEELGTSQGDLLEFTKGIGQALAITGTGAAQASGSLLQLSQALGGGIVRAEEFNSILEGTPRIARAVADGMNLTVSGLRKLVIAGKLTSKEFLQAFQTQLPVLQSEFERTSATIDQAGVVMGNSFTKFVGTLDQATGASGSFSGAVISLAGNVDTLSEKMTSPKFSKFIKLWKAVSTTIFKSVVTVNAYSGGLDDLKEALAEFRKEQDAGAESAKKDLEIKKQIISTREIAIDQIKRQLEEERFLAQFEGSELEGVKARFEVENALRRQKIDLTNEEVQAIIWKVENQKFEIAEAKIAAKDQERIQSKIASDLKSSQEKIRARNKSLQHSFGEAFGAMAADFATGKTEIEDFAKSFVRAIGMMIVKLIALKIASSFLGGFAGGFGGGLVSSFGGGKAEGGSVGSGKSFVVGEEGPELLTMGKSSGFITPNDQMQGRSGGGDQTFNISGLDFGDEQTIRRVASGLGSAVRSGLREAEELGQALGDSAEANAGDNLG